jgi:glucose-6-phosphate 1-dehydrogenase
LAVFDDVLDAPPNHVLFRLSPDVVIELGTRAKKPGDSMIGEAVDLDACRDDLHVMAPYQRLLGDAMRGDQMLFARTDNVAAAWRVVEPILHDHPRVRLYEPGSFGPPEALHVIPDRAWHDPE